MEAIFFEKAISLAENGLGKTSPNPVVGAVLVRNGRIIGEGWHKVAGGDHAEIVAIKSVKNKKLLKGAVLYVTLEPCSHYGKTPPCTKAILEAGISEVYIGMKDPNKKVCGRGASFLRKNGVKVAFLSTKSSIYSDLITLNLPFIKWTKKSLPFVTLKSAITLDGKIATESGESKWITSFEARKDAKRLRSMHDVVLVGAGTVFKDNPTLKSKLRVIIDPNLDLPFAKNVFRDGDVFVACCETAPKSRFEAYKAAGFECKSFGKKRVSVKSLLGYLAQRGVLSVFVEGGSAVNGSFFDAYLKNSAVLDRIVFYMAPKLLGGKHSLPSIGGIGVKRIKNAVDIDWNIKNVGRDLRFSADLF